MQPNKSVEERFVITKIVVDGVGVCLMKIGDKWVFNVLGSREYSIDITELLTSHTNTVLQGVVEKIKNKSEEAVKGLWYVSEDTFSSVLNEQIISNEEKK